MFRIIYVARDKNGELWLHSEKPIKSNEVWLSEGKFEELLLENDWFSEVKWEDEKPRELILK